MKIEIYNKNISKNKLNHVTSKNNAVGSLNTNNRVLSSFPNRMNNSNSQVVSFTAGMFSLKKLLLSLKSKVDIKPQNTVKSAYESEILQRIAYPKWLSVKSVLHKNDSKLVKVDKNGVASIYSKIENGKYFDQLTKVYPDGNTEIYSNFNPQINCFLDFKSKDIDGNLKFHDKVDAQNFNPITNSFSQITRLRNGSKNHLSDYDPSIGYFTKLALGDDNYLSYHFSSYNSKGKYFDKIAESSEYETLVQEEYSPEHNIYLKRTILTSYLTKINDAYNFSTGTFDFTSIEFVPENNQISNVFIEDKRLNTEFRTKRQIMTLEGDDTYYNLEPNIYNKMKRIRTDLVEENFSNPDKNGFYQEKNVIERGGYKDTYRFINRHGYYSEKTRYEGDKVVAYFDRFMPSKKAFTRKIIDIADSESQAKYSKYTLQTKSSLQVSNEEYLKLFPSGTILKTDKENLFVEIPNEPVRCYSNPNIYGYYTKMKRDLSKDSKEIFRIAGDFNSFNKLESYYSKGYDVGVSDLKAPCALEPNFKPKSNT